MWQFVDGFKTHEFLVYSAYYDVRDSRKPLIRVIGVTRANQSEKVMCRMYYDDEKFKLKINYTQTYSKAMKGNVIDRPFLDVPGIISILNLGYHGKWDYHPCYILCPFYHLKFQSIEQAPIPIAVSITPLLSSAQKYSKTLYVMNSQNGGTGTHAAMKNELGLCVKPIHSDYNNWRELISFIELNKILGVSKITVYNESMSESISCVLNYYIQQEHLVSVLAWDLFEKSNISTESMRNRGVQSALNDCFYRNMNEYKYLFSIDLDEFIIPHMHDTIPEMLEYLSSADIEYLQSHWRQRNMMKNVQNHSNPDATTSYNFLNAFFYQNYGKSICFQLDNLIILERIFIAFDP